jgi:hypothetical protein
LYAKFSQRRALHNYKKKNKKEKEKRKRKKIRGAGASVDGFNCFDGGGIVW